MQRGLNMNDDLWKGDAVALRETAKALLVDVDGEENWIPKGQIDDDSEVYQRGDEGELVIPMWLAIDRGWASPKED